MKIAVIVACALVATAHADDLDTQVRKLAGDDQVAVWVGTPDKRTYELDSTRSLPAASVIKTAILIELFAAHAGHLDDPLGTDAIVADDAHAAMTPFSAGQKKEIRGALTGATVRTVGAIMMGSKKASNAVYNASANLAIASLGGPADATQKIHARDERFAGLVVARYMLAPRTPSDNLATAASLAAVLGAVATAAIPRVDASTAEAMAQVMIHDGNRVHKDGNLDSDPMVVVKTGFYTRAGKSPLVYVVAATLAKPTGPRDATARRLDKLTDAIQSAIGK